LHAEAEVMDSADASRLARQLDGALTAEERTRLIADLASAADGDALLEAFGIAPGVQREMEEADGLRASALDPPYTPLPVEATQEDPAS
jgi:hypothetical protein